MFDEGGGPEVKEIGTAMLTDNQIWAWQNKTYRALFKPSDITPEIRTETNARLSKGENTFVDFDSFINRRTDSEGNIQFPNIALNSVREFLGKTRSDERFAWMEMGRNQFNVSEKNQIQGNKHFVPIYFPSVDEQPDRSGNIHNHPEPWIFSGDDVDVFFRDPMSHSMMIGLPGGDIWMMRKEDSPTKFNTRRLETMSEVDTLLTEMVSLEKTEEARGLSDEQINSERLESLQKIGKLSGVSTYRIPSGQNTGIKVK